jgi:hypothetical protein
MFAEILKKKGIKDQIRQVGIDLEQHSEHVRSLLTDIPAKAFYVDSFRFYLKQNNASFEISEDVAVIISSFILTEAKIMELKTNRGITSNYAKAIIRISQIKLAEMSVLYVQRLALRMLLNQEEKVASKLVFDQVKIDLKKRKLVPFYPTMRLLLQEMRRNEVPIVLRIEQFLKGQSEPYGIFSMVFCNFGEGEYYPHRDPKLLLQKMALVFHSVSVNEIKQSKKAIIEKVLKHKVTNLILSASAAHPQYTCQNEGFPFEEPSYQKYLALAYEVGTWRGNPCLFDIKHLSFTKIDEQMIE